MPRARSAVAPAAAPPVPAAAEEQDARSSLAAATGTDHKSLQSALLNDVAAVSGPAPGSEAFDARVAASFGLMAALGPRDGVEGAVAAQFVALHNAGMTALRCAANPALPPEVSSRLRRDAAAMFRTDIEAVEAIEARRGNGARQKIVVEHIDRAVFTGSGKGGS